LSDRAQMMNKTTMAKKKAELKKMNER